MRAPRPRQSRRAPPRRPSTYSEATSFRVNPELREDIERLRKHYHCSTAGDLFRTLIRLQIDAIERAPRPA